MDQDPEPGNWLPTSFADVASPRFASGQVELRAKLRCRGQTAGAAASLMALQLLADDELLAELPLVSLHPGADGLALLEATLALSPPAGPSARRISLSLIGRQTGQPERLLDRWRFALPQRFIQPGLEGAVRLRVTHALPTLEIDAISNPRAAQDRSGTLALEVWSLERRYTGGAFSGQPLGSVTLGSLAGQQRWTDLNQTWHLPVLHDQRASGHLTLMLREWTPAGYVTRDWRELDWPRQQPGDSLSINRSSTAALRSIAGVSDRLARSIVASRPFGSVDELRRVRGMNEHAFCRLRDRVTT